MAAPQEDSAFSELFPAPPPFWQLFTQENVDTVKDLQREGEDIPQDLIPLVPPPPPADGKYVVFSGNYDIHNTLPPLEEIGLTNLFPSGPKESGDTQDKAQSDWSVDRAVHLQRAIRSILVNFLELVGIFSQDATQAWNKWADIENLFINVLHIVNEYRPHQARQSLIEILEGQVETRKAQIQSVKKMRETVDAITSALPQVATTNELDQMANGTSSKAFVAARSDWGDLD
ncbi:MED7-domain-containing protein [Microthyrium microscopicum]|uniref:Mediator of RNA polymerase II transcription subunit 7 n=1 Tax=Microthyrium microscopicum TaxID=703497 RepID=A0A6A6UF21_9PEZI|nr:MED7-domain-containing protein [Microthyrium microscopicum]